MDTAVDIVYNHFSKEMVATMNKCFQFLLIHFLLCGIIQFPFQPTANAQLAAPQDPCFAKDAAPGTVCTGGSLYAGEFSKKKYMTTAGNCSDSPYPVCDGKVDSTTKYWGALNTYSGIADVNDGQANTNTLVEKFKDAEAAKYCSQLRWGGYSDWFLPSENELLLLKSNASFIDSLSSSNWYWSSTEGTWNENSNYRPNIARVVRFDWGASNLTKSDRLLVRCIRIADPKILPKPIAKEYKITNTIFVRGESRYFPNIQKFISMGLSDAATITFKIFSQDFRLLAEVDTKVHYFLRLSFTDDENYVKVLNSTTNPDKIVIVIKNPNPDVPYVPDGFLQNYDVSASVIDISQSKLISQFNIKGNGFGDIYLFRDLILTRENQYKNSFFKAYSLNGKLVKEMNLKNYHSTRLGDFIVSPTGSTLNVMNYSSDTLMSYYDFFTEEKKFEIQTGYQFSLATKNQNLILNWDANSKTVEIISQLDGSKLGKINYNYNIYETYRPIFSREFGLVAFSEARNNMNNYVQVDENVVHIFDLISAKEIATVKCNCAPMSLMKDPEDSRIKLVSVSGPRDTSVVDILSNKLQYNYQSMISFDYRRREYLGFGRFKDLSEMQSNSSKTYFYVFNSKTDSIDYTTEPGYWDKNVVYLSDQSFVVFDSSLTRFEN